MPGQGTMKKGRKYGRWAKKPGNKRYLARAQATMRGRTVGTRRHHAKKSFTPLPELRSMWPGKPKKLGLVS